MNGADNWNPEKLIEAAGSYWQSFTLQAGIGLEVFSALGDNPKSSKDLASMLKADCRALTMLVNTPHGQLFLWISSDLKGK